MGADAGGRTVLVTGATSGIGREAARGLGRLGARVLVHGRDPERGRATVAAIERDGGEATFHRADFTDLDAVRGLAAAVREEDRLDVLVNNAGLSRGERRLVSLGGRDVEETFVANHLAPYLLTHDLAGLLRESAPARVVVTASAVHRQGSLDLDDLAMADYDGLDAYARSKLANVLFALELAERFDPGAVTANALHPGFVPGSRLFRGASLPVRVGTAVASLVPFVGRTTADGAEGLVHLAASDDVAGVTGGYFDGRERTAPAARARDPALRERLWEVSADLVGVDPDWP